MQKLFTDFKPGTVVEWKAQLVKDLKGEAYENLIWHNENGFEIHPMYSGEELKTSYTPAFTHTDWDICVAARPGESREVNAWLLRQLNSGASSVFLNGDNTDYQTVLQDVRLNYIRSGFVVSAEKLSSLKTYLENHYDLNQLNCSVFLSDFSKKENMQQAAELALDVKAYPGIKVLCVDVLPFHNQGCFAYYEVALVLAQLAEYLEMFVAGKETVPGKAFVVKTGVSADYFIQIAKLRAIRRLWKLLKKEYGINHELHVIAETSLTNKSISDNYNNLLRTTVEAMAAVLGGCNELLVHGFDVLSPSDTVLADRMAVNQQLILKEESYFDKMADVACGSYYIETITDSIATRALDAFKQIEKQGGYFACLEKSVFSGEIAAHANAREEAVQSGKSVAIGVNKYKNEKENIQLTAQQIKTLRESGIHNPVLNYELEHYFKFNNA